MLRTLSVHPSTRTAARVAAALSGIPLRDAAGMALSTLINTAVAVEREPAPDSRRVTMVAKTHAESWAALDQLHKDLEVSWDKVLRTALAVEEARWDEILRRTSAAEEAR